MRDTDVQERKDDEAVCIRVENVVRSFHFGKFVED